jgi:SAM-dependent methyltransferase
MGRRTVLATLPKHGVCVEIGIWKGEFSQRILNEARPRELHLIDPWKFTPIYPKRWYGGARAKDQNDMDAIWQSVIFRFAAHPEVRIHRSTSISPVALFPDRYFDWIYIDGDHSYQAVLDDMQAWHRKVKPGGFLCLDDYDWRDENGETSVCNAIQAFLFKSTVGDSMAVKGQFVIRVSGSK